MASNSSIGQVGRFHIDLAMPRVMGIVNVTPDLFLDGSAMTQPVRHWRKARI